MKGEQFLFCILQDSRGGWYGGILLNAPPIGEFDKDVAAYLAEDS